MSAHKVVTVERGTTDDGRPGFAARCETPDCGAITFGGFPSRSAAREALAGHEEAATGLASDGRHTHNENREENEEMFEESVTATPVKVGSPQTGEKVLDLTVLPFPLRIKALHTEMFVSKNDPQFDDAADRGFFCVESVGGVVGTDEQHAEAAKQLLWTPIRTEVTIGGVTFFNNGVFRPTEEATEDGVVLTLHLGQSIACGLYSWCRGHALADLLPVLHGVESADELTHELHRQVTHGWVMVKRPTGSDAVPTASVELAPYAVEQRENESTLEWGTRVVDAVWTLVGEADDVLFDIERRIAKQKAAES